MCPLAQPNSPVRRLHIPYTEPKVTAKADARCGMALRSAATAEHLSGAVRRAVLLCQLARGALPSFAAAWRGLPRTSPFREHVARSSSPATLNGPPAASVSPQPRACIVIHAKCVVSSWARDDVQLSAAGRVCGWKVHRHPAHRVTPRIRELRLQAAETDLEGRDSTRSGAS